MATTTTPPFALDTAFWAGGGGGGGPSAGGRGDPEGEAGADVLAQMVVVRDSEGADVDLFRIRGEHDTMGNLLTAFLLAQADVIEAAHVPGRELVLRVQTAPGAQTPTAAVRQAATEALSCLEKVERAALCRKLELELAQKNGMVVGYAAMPPPS